MASRFSDPALDALMLPFVQGQLAWPSGPVLFLRARDGAALRQFPLPQVVCEQSFRPDAELLERAGLRVVADAAEDGVRYPLVLVLPPRQREEARALLARAEAPAGTRTSTRSALMGTTLSYQCQAARPTASTVSATSSSTAAGAPRP